jgi:CheY-like chemotaxis protein
MLGQKLLLADDSITIQKVVELILAEEGIEIMAVNNGEEALDAVPSFQPDIILADIDMPKMNGYQLCERLKKEESTRDIPVILLTAAFEPVDEELAQQVQADDFLVKPFESQDLLSKIRSVLKASPAQEAGVEAEPAGDFMEAEAMALEESPSEDDDLWAVEEIPETLEAEEAELWQDDAGPGASLEELMGIEEDAGMEAEPLEGLEAEPLEGLEAEPLEGLEAETLEGLEAETVEGLEAETVEGLEDVTVEGLEDVTLEGLEAFEPVEAEAVTHKEQIKHTITPAAPDIAVPSSDEMKRIFERAVHEKITSLVTTLDVKGTFASNLQPILRETIEKILWEAAPDLIEKALREVMKESLGSLAKEIEKVIWETVPDLAETIISKEIERIRSEF